MKSIRLILASGILALFSAAAFAGLNVGNKVDSLVANDDEGNLWSLEDHLGKKNIVVYFYPAAMTGGCTSRPALQKSSALNDLDAVVVGVSGIPLAAWPYSRRPTTQLYVDLTLTDRSPSNSELPLAVAVRSSEKSMEPPTP